MNEQRNKQNKTIRFDSTLEVNNTHFNDKWKIKMNKWNYDWMNEWMNEWINEWNNEIIFNGFVTQPYFQ